MIFDDDSKLIKMIKSLEDRELLEEDLQSVIEWTTANKMELNRLLSSSCYLMEIMATTTKHKFYIFSLWPELPKRLFWVLFDPLLPTRGKSNV